MHQFPFRAALMALCAAILCGCSTTTTSNTSRTATEQLLISNAVDQSLDKIDFSTFVGTKVVLEEKYLDGVDKPYVLASVRHRLLYHGATITTDAKDADIILEARSGGIGTDSSEMFYGMPEIALPGVVSIPELKVVTRSSQRGTAKLGLVAYDAKTLRILGQGGVSIAVANQNSMSVLGVGPFKSGTVKQELDAGTSTAGIYSQGTHLPYVVSFDPPQSRDGEPIRLTRGVKDERR